MGQFDDACIPSLCSIEWVLSSLRGPSEPSALSRNLGIRKSEMPLVPGGASVSLFFLMLRLPPRSTLFPYPTLFRSLDAALLEVAGVAVVLVPGAAGQAAGMNTRTAHGRDDKIAYPEALDGGSGRDDLGQRLKIGRAHV